MKQQKEYYSQLLGREEETRKFRHDIINDLLKIQDYCANEKYQAMSQYIERITGIVISLNKKKYDVGNDVINSVINYYLSPTEKKYSVEVKGFVSDNISIDDRDLCVICGNMIGNAIEAVDRMKEGKIWIEAGAGKEYISLRVKNTYQGKLKFNKEGFPITTKTDKINHGIGTRNIYDVVKKNGGEYLINAKDGIFNAEVILKKSFA
jgi:sensor histidine kinase regulating citrate/malate metabolism